jgi:hypothetical protein
MKTFSVRYINGFWIGFKSTFLMLCLKSISCMLAPTLVLTW